ncbi:hypothetical protein [Propionibacterium freudenreichii]|uniref:hypothetical protein n=1 Tax=Propionibacterium freudenreichii TaxID=1744 RepID=UPI0011089393|nr:hypothetical protein [Propionibacterium freudenreichii]MDK9351157.1 hypothetical protein [Propionibacterium freudenreichii]
MNTTTTRADHRGIDALVAERITDSLNASHRTVAWLSRESGISSPQLHRRLSGLTGFTLTELGCVAMALGVRVSEMVPETSAR